jgi:hypothetical protein
MNNTLHSSRLANPLILNVALSTQDSFSVKHDKKTVVETWVVNLATN